MKAPGLVVPGVLGVLLIALGLFSSYLVGLADWTEILLFVLGLGFVGIELFVLPGTIVFGLAGFVSIVLALILSQQTFVLPSNAVQSAILENNLLDILYLLVLVILGAAVFYKFMPKIPFFNRALLEPPDAPRTGESTRFERGGGDRAALVGSVGVAVTDLRPSGIFEISGGVRHDVVSNGGFIARGRSVRVLEAEGNRIVVEAVDNGGSGESGEVPVEVLFLLVIVGLGMIVAEVFFISAGILSVGAAVSLVSAVFLAFTGHGQAVGFLVLALAAVGAPAALAFALKVLPRTAIGRRILLSGPDHDLVSGAAQEIGLDELRGRTGTTQSVLRPTGFARIDGRRIDVVTRGELIERGAEIEVIEVEGNRVVVAQAGDGQTPTDTQQN
jgi:membrane-bound ClpP family serine protease